MLKSKSKKNCFYLVGLYIIYVGIMKLESNGVLISLRPFNERDCLARIFTRDYGVVVGMMRGAVVAKKNKPLVGQMGNMSWNARLDSQLGTFHWEAEKNMSASLMLNPSALMAMNAAFSLIDTLLPEREPYPVLYDETLRLLSGDLERDYLNWEISLLRELGYALDLSHCSGCGGTDDLHFLSPRTGRAVCDKCATPYIDKLYKLPVNLSVTGRFLESICIQQGAEIPVMRRMLKIN